MAKGVVRARLRKGKDDDIQQALEEQLRRGKDEADIVREALRMYFGVEGLGISKRNLSTAPVDTKPTLRKKEAQSIEPVGKQNGLDSLLESF